MASWPGSILFGIEHRAADRANHQLRTHQVTHLSRWPRGLTQASETRALRGRERKAARLLEQALHSRFGAVGDHLNHASRPKAVDGVTDNHVDGDGQDETDDATEEAA